MVEMESKTHVGRSSMLQLLGIILIVNVIIFDLWWLCSEKSLSWGRAGFLGSLTIVVVIAGLVLIFNERAMNVVFGKNSKLSIASKQAQVDAEAVSKIRKQVEAQRATIDLVATEATAAKKLSAEVAAKNVEAGEKLKEVNDGLREAKKIVSEIEKFSIFHQTVLSAQANSRDAFDQLYAWSRDESFPFREMAHAAYVTARDSHSMPYFISNNEVTWNTGIDPSKLNYETLKKIFWSQPADDSPYETCGLVEYISKRDDFSKLDRLDFLAEILEKHKHLLVCEYAGRYFVKFTGVELKPVIFDRLLNWWKENRDKFKDGDVDQGRKQ